MRRRRALGENASTYRRMGRDAERAGLTKEAEAIYAQAPRYRSLGVQKRDAETGKIRKYKNLRAFNKDCPTRGDSGDSGELCEIRSIRYLTDGSGLATIDVTRVMSGVPLGTWRLHFASHKVLVNHLKKRVTGKTKRPR